MALLRDLPLEGLSPYLIQHRDNPVDWRPWGDEAFEEALGKGVEARNAALAADNDPSEEFRILFTSYVFDDPSDIAQFTLTTKK